jgi:hypothetical protein
LFQVIFCLTALSRPDRRLGFNCQILAISAILAISNCPLPPPIPIPDWRRVKRHHPKSSQIGVDLSISASIGVDLRASRSLHLSCSVNIQLSKICQFKDRASLKSLSSGGSLHRFRSCFAFDQSHRSAPLSRNHARTSSRYEDMSFATHCLSGVHVHLVSHNQSNANSKLLLDNAGPYLRL